jgi:hypothetical protein
VPEQALGLFARPRRKRRTDAASVTSATRRMRPPHRGHARSRLDSFPSKALARSSSTTMRRSRWRTRGRWACPLHHDGEVLRLAGCAIGELGLFTATLPADSPGRVYLAGGLEGRGSVRLVGPSAVRFGVDAVVPIFRTWTTDGTGTAAFRPSVVGAAADVGVGVVLS